MEIKQYRFNPEEKRLERVEDAKKAEDGEKVEVESEKPVETHPEKISTVEAVLLAGLLGLKAYLIYDSKRKEVQEAVSEAKQDIQTQPAAVKEIAGGLVMRIGSLVLEYQREQQEQKLVIKQKFLSSLQKIATERKQLDLLKDYEVVQGETMQESLRRPVEKAGITPEEKAEFKASMDPIIKAEQQAKNKVKSFINGLLDPSH